MEPNLTTDKARRDYTLVLAAREGGDQRAYSDLMKHYWEPLYMLMLKMTGNPTEADDLTIETFGKAFCQINAYTPVNAFSTWLFSIGTNTAIDHIRKQRLATIALSTMATTRDDEVFEYPMPADAPTPEEAIIATQRHEVLRNLVTRLKPKYRQLVELRFFDELSYDEIASRTGLPLSTVKIRLMRARNLMADMVAGRKEQL
ncbi:MAG: sigma-70 family RNA polymerase sigma factor [Bacteroidales bacterium]|nr:sigma-70 family RNA polymerase sigma factor [Bacteroidales bacterium]